MIGTSKKMSIEAYKEADYSGEPTKTFEVMFNPNTYSQKYEVNYDDAQGPGDSASKQVFGGIKPQDYTFDFLFDGTGTAAEKVDVHEVIEDFLTITAKLDGEIHRPFYLKLSWGSLIVKCVLKSADVTYTLFKSDGYPLRAKVKATFTENIPDTERAAEERESSPDLTHVRTVKQGDHLTLLSDRLCKDPAYYLQLAQVNGLTNFRRLAVGQVLRFPPIKDRSA